MYKSAEQGEVHIAEAKMKRKLVHELSEGFEALSAERNGKITLTHHAANIVPAPKATAETLETKGELARRLRINERLPYVNEIDDC